jgi:hypothetical protein
VFCEVCENLSCHCQMNNRCCSKCHAEPIKTASPELTENWEIHHALGSLGTHSKSGDN